MKKYLKGEIYYAYLDPVIGSEENGYRPVVIVQSNYSCTNANTVLVAPLTKSINRNYIIPSHVFIKKNKKIKYDSIVLIEQIRAIDKIRLRKYICTISDYKKSQIDYSIINTFDIKNKEILVYEK